MLYISDYKAYPESEKGNIAAIGSFDGVHLGHVAVIQEVIAIAKESNKKSVIITFNPHPLLVLKEDIEGFLIINHEQKIDLIASLGVDIIVSISFDKEFSKIKASDFIKEILVKKINPLHLVTGSNFSFGYKSEGNVDLLNKLSKEIGFKYTEINLKGKLRSIYSSTNIRKTIKTASFEDTKLMLGRYFSIRGKIVKGKQIGNTIGFPTANVELCNFIRPKFGVYAVRIYFPNVETVYHGVANIGIKPTLEDSKEALEVYIFNFTYDIYDKIIEVEFIKFLRSEIKFDNLNQLKSQIQKDCIKAAKFLL